VTDETLRKDDRVLPSGVGPTATWPKIPGTIIRRMGAHTWEVQWDGATFQDQMHESELTKLTEELRDDD
jgi:hypothetical protein